MKYYSVLLCVNLYHSVVKLVFVTPQSTQRTQSYHKES